MSKEELTMKEVREVCGLEQGDNCCIALMVSDKGFECNYDDFKTTKNLEGQTMHQRWLAGLTNAKRLGCNYVKEIGYVKEFPRN